MKEHKPMKFFPVCKSIKQIVILSVIIFNFALTVSLSQSAQNPKKGGNLVFGVENEPAGFDVIKARGLAVCDAIIANTVMERLFDMDDEGNLIPALGLSVKPLEDGKTWMVVLRKGVTFHDGTPFNADAVVLHWNRMLNPENKYRGLSLLSTVVSVSKADEHTVQFILKHPWEPFPRILCAARTLTNLIPSPKAVDEGKQMRAPVGTGPFMFKEWKSGDQVVVVKNPYYWQKEKPHIDEISFKITPDPQTRYASLKSGQMKLIWMDRGHIIDRAKTDDHLFVHKSEGNGAEIFLLNTKSPPLDNPLVRKAIAHAWNQEVCVKMSYRGSIPVIYHPMDASADCGDSGYRTHDLDKAKKLITEYGKPVTVECFHSNTQRGKEQGEILQQFSKKIGVEVKPTGLAFGPVIKNVYTRNYDISTWRIPSAIDFGPIFMYMFHSESRGNLTGYSNPQMDKLLEMQKVETDPVRRNRILCDIARLINEDVPIIYRGGKRYHIIAETGIQDIGKIKNGIVRLTNVWIEK